VSGQRARRDTDAPSGAAQRSEWVASQGPICSLTARARSGRLQYRSETSVTAVSRSTSRPRCPDREPCARTGSARSALSGTACHGPFFVSNAPVTKTNKGHILARKQIALEYVRQQLERSPGLDRAHQTSFCPCDNSPMYATYAYNAHYSEPLSSRRRSAGVRPHSPSVF